MLMLSPIWLIPHPAHAQIFERQDYPKLQVVAPRPVIRPIPSVQPTIQPNTVKSITVKKKARPTTIASNVENPKIQQNDSGRNYSKEEVKALIISYSKQYGIAPETPLCIAEKESGFNQYLRINRVQLAEFSNISLELGNPLTKAKQDIQYSTQK